MRRLKTSNRVGNRLRVMSGWGVVDAVVSRLSAMVGYKIVDYDKTSEFLELDIGNFSSYSLGLPLLSCDNLCNGQQQKLARREEISLPGE